MTIRKFPWLVLFILACNSNADNQHATLKKVPFVLVNVLDAGFNYLQDTVYYEQKPFSGIQFGLFENGDTAFVKPCLKGLEEGICKQWYPNTQLAQERLYINGKKEGTHKAWWPDGKPKFSYQFDGDEFNGTVREWYDNGNLFKDFHFNKGHEEGSQQLFWINGKVRANYIIKNGRRYGLLGTKNCINVADSVFIPR